MPWQCFRLLDVLADVADPRRAQGQLYKLPPVLLFVILAVVTGCNSYRGVEPRGSPDFDRFNGRAAAQVLSAFAADTARVPARVDIAGKSNESPAA